ncbi:MAG: carbon monoxide dehydrogenase subunit G [Alphaproteobacteria bacterium]|nr:carbon monoxide dehydrogenase subunit G [Alphaproteobacteria bacterium]
MDMTGEYRIPAAKQLVWNALNDPQILKKAIPNCEAIDKTSDTEMQATVNAKVGPLKARFQGKVTLSNIDAPNSYTLTGEGQGAGGVGFAKGVVDVALKDDGGATVLTYKLAAQVGGKLAQIGSRLIDSVAQQQAKQFFTAFSQHFEAIAAAAPPPAAPASAPVAAPSAVPAASAPAPSAAPAAAKPAAVPASPTGSSDFGYYFWPGALFVVMLLVLYLVRG